eukprot:1089284-Pyramimonas_sp.AAC.1
MYKSPRRTTLDGPRRGKNARVRAMPGVPARPRAAAVKTQPRRASRLEEQATRKGSSGEPTRYRHRRMSGTMHSHKPTLDKTPLGPGSLRIRS